MSRAATRKQVVKVLQSKGWTREAARRSVYGDTRKQATSHPTRGALLQQAMIGNREKRREAVGPKPEPYPPHDD